MDALFAWIESTSIATHIASSEMLTASLSATHVVGFTLVMSGALVANLRPLGVLLARRPALDIVSSANRVILLGLAISIVTGALLFSARATEASANGTFRLKMALLLFAALFHFTVQHRLSAPLGAMQTARAISAISLSLWLGLAVTACAFILLE